MHQLPQRARMAMRCAPKPGEIDARCGLGFPGGDATGPHIKCHSFPSGKFG